MGNYFPTEMIQYIQDKNEGMRINFKKYSFEEFVKEERQEMDYSNKSFNTYSTVTYIPIVYFPPALGIIVSKIVAKIIGMKMVSTSYMLYFARLFSLIATVGITALAIKITPMRKKTFLTVGLIPMYLFLSSMVSYDNLLNSSLLLALAIILNVTYKKEKIELKDFVILGIIGTILLNIKTIYFLIFMLMFLIPVKKFGVRKDKIKKGLFLLGGILLLTIILKIPYLFLDNSNNANIYIGKQINFILNNPIEYFKILILNIKDQRLFQLTSMVGLTGLLDVNNPIAIVSLTYINLLMIGLAEGITEDFKISRASKIVIIIYDLLSIICIYTALYITWTPGIFNKIGTNIITGVQGRYFLPLVMPSLLLLSFNKGKKMKIWKMIQDNHLLVPIILLLITIGNIFLRFWI